MLPKRVGLPYSAAVGAGVFVLLLFTATSTIRDVDLYWHLLAGEQLSRGVSPSVVGSNWSFAPNPLAWTSTQWLSELSLYQGHRFASWGSLAAFRLLSTAATIVILAWTTLRHRPIVLAAFPFLVAATLVAILAQERPQQFTWIGAALLGGVLVKGFEGTITRWWLFLPSTVLWANAHGGWILVPSVLTLVAVARFVGSGFRDETGRRAVVIALASTLCGALTPSGIAGWAALIRFAGSTDHLIEWNATEPVSGPGFFTVIMLLLAMLGWSRPTRTPPSEFLVVLILLVFSWTAWRNMVPALLLLAPLVARRLTLAFPECSERAEPKWAAPVGIGIAVAGLALGLATIPGRSHLPFDEQPVHLAKSLRDLGTQERVLNDYNVAGTTLYFGGPGVQVAIDGRADRYSSTYIRAYTEMLNLRGGWESLLRELDPTSAILEADSPLTHVLTTERGWEVEGEDAGFVLLIPPREVGIA